MTKAGQTFCVMPKSTGHTSPRSGTRTVLLLVQRAERIRGQSREIVIRQIVRQGNTFDDGMSKLLTLRFGEPLDLAKSLDDSLCHALNIHGRKEMSKWGTKTGGVPIPLGKPAKKRADAKEVGWLFDMGMTAKIRPAVVHIADQLDAPRSLIIHIPITRRNRGSELEAPPGHLPFLDPESTANVQAIGSLPSVRFEKRLDLVPEADFYGHKMHP
jgi:mRNA interferase MazF